MSKDLTEQWKNGELPRGVYYIKYKGNFKTDVWRGYYWEDSWSENIEEVLAPVPSYEEWQDLREFADYSVHNRDELTKQINFWMDKHTQIEKENQQLRELLKRCRDFINYEVPDHCIDDVLIDKIDNAIGEK